MRHACARALVGGMGLVLIVATCARVPIWQDERALWTAATIAAPLKPRPWVNLGRAAALAGDPLVAELADRRALLLARRPGRSRDESQGSLGYASANLALLLQATPARNREAQGLMVAAILTLPNDPYIQHAHAAFLSGPAEGLLAR